MVAGLLKYERRPLQQIIDDLYVARGDLFDDLFSRAWVLLDEAGRRILMVMTFFPDSASVEALSATADMTGFDFDRATERLTDLSLLDVQQDDLHSEPRYVLHTLVHAFAGARLAEQQEFEEAARKRWVKWYIHFIKDKDKYWENLNELEQFEPEYETLGEIARWTCQQGWYAETLRIADGLQYYCYIRGFWDERLKISSIHAEAAHKLPDFTEETRAIRQQIEVFSKQEDVHKLNRLLLKLDKLSEKAALSQDGLSNVYYDLFSAKALYSMTKRQFEEAKQWFKEAANLLDPLSRRSVKSRREMAICEYEDKNLEQAREDFMEVLQDSEEISYQRSSGFCQIYLAAIDLDKGNVEDAVERLQEQNAEACTCKDNERLMHVQRLYARLHILRGDLPAAHSSLLEAIDLFERMGMRRELAEAREELARLEAQMAEAAE
jgi:LuxR family glucitol operon transcriptional activator